MIPGRLPSALAAAFRDQEWNQRAADALRELGPPIYAIGGEWLPRTQLGGFSGMPCTSVLLRFHDARATSM